ncbi:MAG: prolipoprotein diacylglyceryl transferase, partial [Planctomycetes bacterium]|nr:prolipoprotein diacylglyceryl transferase [Planctomycetota bacterium]
SLIAGVVGARLFYVVHYFDSFKGDLLSVFAIWEGGLELLGGVLLAITVIILYMRYHKLPIRQYLDILAVALMLALAFGRIGCFLNSCCYGKPTDMSWGVRFSYDSYPYRSQVHANPDRNRLEPQLELPDEFFGYYDETGSYYSGLKPYDKLSEQQKEQVDNGPYRCLPVHPTQLYSSLNGLFLCGVLWFFWHRYEGKENRPKKYFAKPGCTFGLMFVVYGITRFLIEFIRDDNPYEFDGITVSQNISVGMIILGFVLMVAFHLIEPKMRINNNNSNRN